MKQNANHKNKHAVALGRLGKGRTSARKKLSSRANGKLGGRPKNVSEQMGND